MSEKAVEIVLSWMTKRIDGPLINKGFQRRSIFRRKIININLNTQMWGIRLEMSNRQWDVSGWGYGMKPDMMKQK